MSASDFDPMVFRVTSLGRVTRNTIPTVTREDWSVYLTALRAMLGLPDSPISSFDTVLLDLVLSKLIVTSEAISNDETGANQIASAIFRLSEICQFVQEMENIGNNEGGSLFHSLRNMQDLSEFLSIFSDPYALGQFNWTFRTYSTYTWYGTADDVEAAIDKFRHSLSERTTSPEPAHDEGNILDTSFAAQDEVGDVQGALEENDSTVLDRTSGNDDDTVLNPITSVLENRRVQRESVSDHAKLERESVSDHAKLKRESVSDHAKLERESVSDHAKLKRESVSDHAKLKRESVSDYAKIKRESVSDHAKLKKPDTNSTVSTVATTDAYEEYFKYRYDEKSAKNTSNVNDVESVSKAIRAVNIQIAVCDSTTTKSQAHSRSAYDDMSDNANYYKYRYDEKQLTGYSDTIFETESNSTQNCYESFQDENTHYVVDHHNGTIAEFDPDAYAPDRYEHIVENDTAYVVDHYNEEIYKDFGCDEEDCNSYFDHSSLHNYEYYTDDDSHGEESYWSDGY